jgi:hypothetical protein
VLYDHLYTDHFDAVFIGKRAAVVSTCHRALRVVVDQFAQKTSWSVTGYPTQI